MSDLIPQLTQQVFNGLSLGAIYALIAIGYTMVYGIIGMINFAHGEIYMIGAYVGLVTLTAIGTNSGLRSEEHTSELQSLMRNSYAVFCLKKKTKKQNKE